MARIRQVWNRLRWRSRLIAKQAKEISALRAQIPPRAIDLDRIREASRQLLRDELSCDLARIVTTLGLVGWRLDRLQEKLDIGTLREEDTDVDAAAPPMGREDIMWQVSTGMGTCVCFVRRAGHGPRSCTLVVKPRDPMKKMKKGWEIPITPVMSRALMDSLARLHSVEPTRKTPISQACEDGAKIAAALGGGDDVATRG